MVFCEAQCRHHHPCDILIAADRPHPTDGVFFVHQSADHHRHEVHEWRSRAGTLVGKGQCQVRSSKVLGQLAEEPFTITVKIPGK